MSNRRFDHARQTATTTAYSRAEVRNLSGMFSAQRPCRRDIKASRPVSQRLDQDPQAGQGRGLEGIGQKPLEQEIPDSLRSTRAAFDGEAGAGVRLGPAHTGIPAVKKKSELGLKGPIKRTKVERQIQEALMEAIDKTVGEGISLEKACEVLDLPRRRYYRWQDWSVPQDRQAWNRMLPQEEEAILSAARREDLAHLRTAGLMVWGQETGAFHSSLTSVYRVLKKASLVKAYELPRRKKPVAPDVRSLMDRPLRILAYDETQFRTVCGLIVSVIPILDMYSRKFLHFGIAIRAAAQEDIKKVWDETLRQEGLADAKDITILADRGGAMKGEKTKKHLEGKWFATLAYARPYTPDDNAWIESFIKGLKYHHECPEAFETVLDVEEWVKKYQGIYNDYPHSALKYVTPNQEHRGLGAAIRLKRKDNLLRARQKRLAAYRDGKRKNQKCPQPNSGVSGYGGAIFRGSNRILDGLENKNESKNRNFGFRREPKETTGIQAALVSSSKELCRF